MGLQRVANGFLSNGVVGKWNQYCGVKCILYKNVFYLLEGDQADGYCIHTISTRVMDAAGLEVCEAAVKLYIENIAISLFYLDDGSGYKEYNPEDFPPLGEKDKLLSDEIYKYIERELKGIRINRKGV